MNNMKSKTKKFLQAQNFPLIKNILGIYWAPFYQLITVFLLIPSILTTKLINSRPKKERDFQF